jgi:hypothetical protein
MTLIGTTSSNVMVTVQGIESDVGGYKHSLSKRSKGYDGASAMSHSYDLYWDKGQIPDFISFMTNLCLHYAATDPRDFIFAYAGLSNDLSLRFVPDYSKSTPEVFASATRQFISATHNLDVLAYVAGHYFKEMYDLPTWSVAWSKNRGKIFHPHLEPKCRHSNR